MNKERRGGRKGEGSLLSPSLRNRVSDDGDGDLALSLAGGAVAAAANGPLM